MSDHIVKSYDQDLATLDRTIAVMGGRCEQLLANAFAALERRDPKRAEAAVARNR